MTDYRHTREPDPAWQADLERLAPRSDRNNWLKIHWFAGWDYEPVQRWRIFEMVPNPGRFTGLEEVLNDLKGLSPRHGANGEKGEPNGQWITEGFKTLEEEPDTVKRRWQSWSTVDFDQWTLYQETGCLANPAWIIQGSHGGHKWRLNRAELGIFEAHGISEPDLPLPGDLPYAEYDQRTFVQLAEFDRLRKWKQGLGWDDRMDKGKAGLWVYKEKKDDEEEYNAALMKWIDTQVENAVDDMSRQSIPDPSDMLRGDRHYNIDQDAEDQAFIEETATR